jgi:hypothetical protein
MATQGDQEYCGCVVLIGSCVRSLISAVGLVLMAALERFTPWQLVVSTLTGVYAVRNIDKILGLGCEFLHPLRQCTR